MHFNCFFGKKLHFLSRDLSQSLSIMFLLKILHSNCTAYISIVKILYFLLSYGLRNSLK